MHGMAMFHFGGSDQSQVWKQLNWTTFSTLGVFPVRDSDSPLTPIQNNVANIGSQVSDYLEEKGV